MFKQSSNGFEKVGQWDCPTARRAVGPNAATRGETEIVQLDGLWANADVWIAASAQWWVAGVVVRLYGVGSTAQTLLAEVDLSTVTPPPGGGATLFGRVAVARGAPCLGFRVTIDSGAAAITPEPVGSAVQLELIAWGTETCPEGLGEGPIEVIAEAQGQYNDPLPTLADEDFAPLQLDERGRLLNVPSGQYNATPPVLADEDYAILQLDEDGNQKTAEQFAPQYEDNTNAVAATVERPMVAVATHAPSVYMRPLAASGIAASEVIKASPASLFALNALMTRQEATTGPQFLQLFNRTTAAAGGAVPLASFALNFCQFAAAIADPTTDPPCFMDRLTLDHAFFSHGGMLFSAGLVWGISSTAGTFTASAGVNIELHAIYR